MINAHCGERSLKGNFGKFYCVLYVAISITSYCSPLLLPTQEIVYKGLCYCLIIWGVKFLYFLKVPNCQNGYREILEAQFIGVH